LIPDPFDDLADALRETAQGFARTNDALMAAALGLARAVEASRDARTERSDLRETVHRLEELVMQLAADVRALRQERGNGQ
jgi:hypothetical protein